MDGMRPPRRPSEPNQDEELAMSVLSATRRPAAFVGVLAALALAAGVAAGTGSSREPSAATTGEPPAPHAGFAAVIERVSPAVVSIEIDRAARAQSNFRHGGPPDAFKRFFGKEFSERFGLGPRWNRPDRGPMHRWGAGSGFIVDAEGHVVTSDHVIAGADTVTVTLDDGTSLKATVAGRDPKTDLALLKVESDTPLPAVRFAEADEARVGDWVVAVGNPFGLGKTATLGMVSARGRGPGGDHLQIDAPINHGNSGGPSFNARGEVIGVNTAIFSPNGGNVGIGFAVPASTAKQVVAALKSHGKVSRGWLGVQIQPVTEDIAASLGLPAPEGVIIARVMTGSPAEKTGLAAGDVVTAVDGQPMADVKALASAIAAIPAGQTARIAVWRDGAPLELKAEIAEAAVPVASAPNERDALERFGLRLEDRDPEDGGGVQVADVAPGSTAARKGVRPGDMVTAVGKSPVGSVAEVDRHIAEARANGRQAALFLLKRGDGERFVALPFSAS